MVGIFDIEMVITGLRLIYCKGTAFEIYCRGTYKESRMLLYSSTGWIPSSSALLLFLFLHCQVRLVLPYLFLFSIVCQLLEVVVWRCFGYGDAGQGGTGGGWASSGVVVAQPGAHVDYAVISSCDTTVSWTAASIAYGVSTCIHLGY
jgi:hypothetical protein